MSYWLCLSFLYHRYGGDCKIKAYADDHQVGEITLTDSIRLKTVSLEGSPVGSRVKPKHPVCRVHILPEKLYMFEIKEHQLNDRITIKIENDFNNYTNGFMTRFSFINFRQIFLVPDCLLKIETLKKIRERNANFVDKELLEQPLLVLETSSPYLYYEPRSLPDDHPENFRFKKISRENSGVKTMPYPGDGENTELYHTNLAYHLYPGDGENTELYHTNLGGSFIVDFSVSRKHQMIHLGGSPMGRPGIRMNVFRTLWAFNQLNTST
tara:strand:- start:3204 stop:4004 length:801 start_codon:yes stop_codon:yes gene_type:complete